MIHNLLAYKMNIDILLLTETFNKTKLIAEEYYNGWVHIFVYKIEKSDNR